MVTKEEAENKALEMAGLNAPEEIFKTQGQVKFYIKEQPIFYDKNGLWWFWNKEEFKWQICDEVDILNAIEQITGEDIITPKNRTLILNSLKQECRKTIPKPIKNTWIQFKDEIYDIATGESFKAKPDFFVTNPIPYGINKERFENTPIIDKIFSEWVGEEYIKTLHQIIAYCTIPSYPIHRLFCFIGAGMNGKSCFLRLLVKFLGESNTCSTELDTLMSSRFEVTRLHKKLICIMGETNFSELNKTSLLKKLTGQDIVGFEYKNKNPFEDKNYAKILIATNNLPETTDKTIGFYRRWCIIDFPNQFSEERDILEEIPEEEFECLALKCLSILKDLLKERKFHKEGSLEERERKYEEKSNPFDKFWRENIEESPDDDISKKKFNEELNKWCEIHKFRKLSDVSISKFMKEKGIITTRLTMEWVEVPFGKDKPRYWAWGGIKFKNEMSKVG